MILATSSTTQRLAFCIAIALTVLAGCGQSGVPLVTVTGKVSFKGQPVDGAQVAFFVDGTGTPALGTTTADGTFELTSREPGDGAQEGSHKVTVSKIESVGPVIPAGESMEAAAARKTTNPVEKMLLPKQYADASTTPLSFSVKKGDKNHFDIELKE